MKGKRSLAESRRAAVTLIVDEHTKRDPHLARRAAALPVGGGKAMRLARRASLVVLPDTIDQRGPKTK